MGALTTLWAKISSEPQAFGEMIRLWLFVAMGAGLMVMSDANQAQLLTAISVTITFFTRKASTANVMVEQKVQKEVLHREATGTGIGMGTVAVPSMPSGTGTDDGRG